MNAYAATPQKLYLAGLKLVQDFAEANDIPLPRFITSFDLTTDDATIRRLVGDAHWRNTGMQWGKNIWVNVLVAARPGRGTYRQWSFPGYKVDRTPYGVIAHEFGHWVAKVRRLRFAAAFYRARPVSGYEPNRSEAIAETIKLFITNSDLLRRGSPVRWEGLTDSGLVPVVTDTYDRVLARHGATTNIIEAAVRWANR